jgi:hypothetical protein
LVSNRFLLPINERWLLPYISCSTRLFSLSRRCWQDLSIVAD